MKIKSKDIFLSWDFVIAIILTLATYALLPSTLQLEFCKSFYNIGITVLSIVFSLFFAALAIIMASPDNDFINFMEEEGDFTDLLYRFKFVLITLFISLIYSIVLFVMTEYKLSTLHVQTGAQHFIFFLVFEFLFSYSLIATLLSVDDTIKFSKFRARFISNKNRN